MDRWEDACARLCLSSRAAWEPGMPSLMTRRAVHMLMSSGILQGLVIRYEDQLSRREAERIRLLLSRAKAVYDVMHAYEESGYQILLPGECGWPGRLDALGVNAPLFLFAKGNLSLTGRRCAAVAGSRDITPAQAQAAEKLGAKMAGQSLTLVSGGARGVDLMAQRGALAAGGTAIIVPAKPAREIMETPYARQAYEEGKLLILCDSLPDEPFTPQKAIARNHTIYALGEAAVVVAPRNGKGGTWRGASDCLGGGWTPVFTLEGDGISTDGSRALDLLGAKPLPADHHVPLTQVLFSADKQFCLFDSDEDTRI